MGLILYLFLFLGECFRGECSESFFSLDKCCCGWRIWKSLEEGFKQ